jgi:hypothetical protein
MAADDARAAATIRTTLSGSVIAGALVVLGAQAAIATFTIDKKEHLTWFYIWSVIGAAALVASMIAGAKGITAVYADGYGGKWERGTGKMFFGPQAVLAIGGAVAVLISVYTGTLKPPEGTSAGASQRIAALERQTGELARQLQTALGELEAIKKKLGEPASYDEEARYRAIVEVQGTLKARGLYGDGAVDGLVGPKTRRALREFQRREGLPVTGRMDSATLKRLGL